MKHTIHPTAKPARNLNGCRYVTSIICAPFVYDNLKSCMQSRIVIHCLFCIAGKLLLLAISTISLVDNCYIYIVLDIHQIVYTFHPST